jgi:hypothetical protein
MKRGEAERKKKETNEIGVEPNEGRTMPMEERVMKTV